MTDLEMEKMSIRELFAEVKANEEKIAEQHEIIKEQLQAIMKELKVLGVDLDVNN